jgi:diadenosine tetraphosphate (Ap4A) HIT family hydrolase
MSSSYSSSSTKVKVLIFGSIAGEGGSGAGAKIDDDSNSTVIERLLQKKLLALHESKAGPFDAAFVVGSCSGERAREIGGDLPIPVYLHHVVPSTIAAPDDAKGNSTAAAAAAAAAAAKAATTEQERKEAAAGSINSNGSGNDNDVTTYSPSTSPHEPPPIQPKQLAAPNLFCLLEGDDPPGIWSLDFSNPRGGSSSFSDALVVAACPPRIRVDDDKQKQQSSALLLRSVDHPSYRGCDMLLSVEPPQGSESLLAGLQKGGGGGGAGGGGVSYDVADVALRARARYHFFPSLLYEQSGAFRHVPSSTSTSEPRHAGRLISLAPVSNQKEKDKKCVHALGLVPLLAMSDLDFEGQKPLNLLPCPFTDAAYEVDNMDDGAIVQSAARRGPVGRVGVAGLSESSARRILAEERQKSHHHEFVDGSSRFAQQQRDGRRRRRGDEDDNNGTEQTGTGAGVDPNGSTLFVHGLHRDVSGRLQSAEMGDALLLHAFSRFGGSIRRIRRPVGGSSSGGGGSVATSSFCFVEMASHRDAAQVLEETGGRASVAGVYLTIKWGTQHSSGGNKRNGDGSGGEQKGFDSDRDAKKLRKYHPERLTESEAKNSTVLYFKLAQSASSSSSAQLSDSARGEALRAWAESVLEAALNENVTEDDDRVTAQDEPALHVQARVVESFGFLDFASHAAASMAIATLTGSVDGGRVMEPSEKSNNSSSSSSSSNQILDLATRPEALRGVTIYAHWAHARASHPDRASDNNVIEDGSGFKFERKHFPPDSRHDCWFCLASNSCEKHLITGVYDGCYAAMPKGPVHPGHVLLVPIRHSSQGALKDVPVASEMEKLKARLREHASAAYDCDLFVFERAIQTRGGYHTHVQCVPVQRQLGQRLLTTMVAQAGKAGMDLKEIKSDIGASALLADDDDDHDEEGGYFYAEIPIASGFRRFLHRQIPGRHRGGAVPLQLGREVVAAVLEKPELAHWKSCLLDKEEEIKLVTQFRESFVA